MLKQSATLLLSQCTEGVKQTRLPFTGGLMLSAWYFFDSLSNY